MASSVDLGRQLETFVAQLVKTGRYNSRSEILREGVRIIHERETRLAALDASVAKGLQDSADGKVRALDDAATQLAVRYEKPPVRRPKKMKVVVTDAAFADLEQIGDHIAKDNPTRAGSFVAEILDQARTLANMPERYPLVARYEAKGVRRMLHGNYAVFYRIEPERVAILHVLHGARDYEAFLFPEG